MQRQQAQRHKKWINFIPPQWNRRIAPHSIVQSNPLKSTSYSPHRMNRTESPTIVELKWRMKEKIKNSSKMYLHSAFHELFECVYQCMKSKGSGFCMRWKIHAGIFGIQYECFEGEVIEKYRKEKAQAIRDQTMLSPSSYHDFRRHCRRRACVRFSLSFRFSTHRKYISWTSEKQVHDKQHTLRGRQRESEQEQERVNDDDNNKLTPNHKRLFCIYRFQLIQSVLRREWKWNENSIWKYDRRGQRRCI